MGFANPLRSLQAGAVKHVASFSIAISRPGGPQVRRNLWWSFPVSFWVFSVLWPWEKARLKAHGRLIKRIPQNDLHHLAMANS